MKKKKNKIYSGMVSSLFIIAIITGGMFDTTFAKTKDVSKNEAYYEWSTVFDKVLQRVRFGYVEEVSDSLFVRKAIEGGMGVLDPHTTFFDPKDYEDLRLHTEGKYGGLGMLISIRDKILTIMSPYEGTPADRAGLRSGDRILKIDGKSTKGLSSDKAANKMRGEPGTKVTLTIQREGEEPVDYEITREVINIKSVPYAGLLNDSIGYVRLNSFSQTAASEVAQKVDSLREIGMKSLIFDLRSNPGGLLIQAGEISELFLKRGSLVVFTKGREGEKEQKFFTRSSPHIPQNMPLVVLVNKGSASASEIVAGAIQDLDRGIVLGDTTFGKGSVQSVFPIDETRHMKMTTAFYYTPSGRCINRPENGVKGDGELEEEFDENINEADKIIADDIKKEMTAEEEEKKDSTKTEVFFTQNGRKVYGGGGIIPDTIVKIDPHPYVVRKLSVKDMFFKFANYYYPILEKQKIVVDTNFKVSDKILNDFYAYLDSTKQDYDTFADRKYYDFKVYLGLEQDTSVDSAALDYLKVSFSGEDLTKLNALIAELDKMMKANRSELLNSEKEYIARQIQNALFVRVFGQDNAFVQRVRLRDDEQLTAAMNILKDRKKYNALLVGSGKNDKKTKQ
ncbi:MAG: S41 family peptidase [Chitinivibrionia bacterium]|nr:S41 family peptidase [Chitinivibrionia bacterium]